MLSKNEFNFTKKDEKVLPVSFKKKQCKNLQNYHSYKNLNKMSFKNIFFVDPLKESA